jgi:hypothetical protein
MKRTLVLFLAGACSQTEGAPGALADAAASSAVDAPDDDPVLAGDPIGTWAGREVIVTVAQAPVIGTTTTRTVNLTQLAITADGAGYAASRTVCDVQLESSSPLATPSLLPAFVAALPVRVIPVTHDGARLRFAGPLELRGVELADPATDALPTRADDPRVRDLDGDGHGGMTVRIEIIGLGNVETYLVQREQIDLVGGFASADRMTGAADVRRLEQVVIGASNRLFETTPDMAVDAASSRYELVRTGAGCAEIIARAGDLFED